MWAYFAPHQPSGYRVRSWEEVDSDIHEIAQRRAGGSGVSDSGED